MRESVRVSDVKFTAASEEQVRTGLLGFLCFVVNAALRVDGCTLRRTAAGKLTVSYPARRDARGRQHSVVCPIAEHFRRDVQHQILAQLGIEEGST